MRAIKKSGAITFGLALALSCAAQQQKAVIVLTYDDALRSQLDVALPQLDSAALTATFFLDANGAQEDIPRWRAAAKRHFELANHTVYHPCLIREGDTNSINNSARYTVAGIMREIALMNRFLFAIDGRPTARTYAYPCTETEVSGHSYLDTLRRSGLVRFARMGGDRSAIITNPRSIDPLLVPSWAVTGNPSGADLIAYVQKVQQQHGTGIFMFHGVGGDYITTSAQAHRELVAYLAGHRKEIDVLTFAEAMERLLQ